MRPFAFRFFFNETFSRSLPEPRKSPYWFLTLVCSCETFVFLLVLADILSALRPLMSRFQHVNVLF